VLVILACWLAEYYFDIETVPLEQYRNHVDAGLFPDKAKIISMQMQRLDRVTGQPAGPLIILREWENGCSERMIVELFKNLYLDQGPWNFVPVGNNLLFEFRFMKYKLSHYFGLEGLKLGQRPTIDLKPVMVIVNGGSFKGYSILLGKSGRAANMAKWYYDNDWQRIEQYIEHEAMDFVRVYSTLKEDLPKLRQRFI